jgi:hypothetical protein
VDTETRHVKSPLFVMWLTALSLKAPSSEVTGDKAGRNSSLACVESDRLIVNEPFTMVAACEADVGVAQDFKLGVGEERTVTETPVQMPESRTQSQRSPFVTRNRRGRVRCSTCSWCRRASTSSWSAARERAHGGRSGGARQEPTSLSRSVSIVGCINCRNKNGLFNGEDQDSCSGTRQWV